MKRPIRLVTALTSLAAMLMTLAAAQPVAAADVELPYPGCPRMITNADDGRTLTLAGGECATLSLDPKEIWDTPWASGRAVRVFDFPTFAPDQRWALAAGRRGSATITSTGVPNCDPGEPCPLYIRTFTVISTSCRPTGAPDSSADAGATSTRDVAPRSGARNGASQPSGGDLAHS